MRTKWRNLCHLAQYLLFSSSQNPSLGLYQCKGSCIPPILFLRLQQAAAQGLPKPEVLSCFGFCALDGFFFFFPSVKVLIASQNMQSCCRAVFLVSARSLHKFQKQNMKPHHISISGCATKQTHLDKKIRKNTFQEILWFWYCYNLKDYCSGRVIQECKSKETSMDGIIFKRKSKGTHLSLKISAHKKDSTREGPPNRDASRGAVSP